MSAPNFHASLANPGLFREPAVVRLGRLFAELGGYQTGATMDFTGKLHFEVDIDGDDLKLYVTGDDAVTSGMTGRGRMPDPYMYEGTQAKLDALNAGEPFSFGA